jgi:hypothetical protein
LECGNHSNAFDSNSEVGWQVRAFSTTETLSTTEGTDFAWVNSQSVFPCFIIIVSELSGSQCFSGFLASIHESTSELGFKDWRKRKPQLFIPEQARQIGR